jgi:hypothetical protein
MSKNNLLLVLYIILSSSAFGASITCKRESSIMTRELSFSSSHVELIVSTSFDDIKSQSNYLTSNIACGERINSSQECTVEENYNVAFKGDYSFIFMCPTGQHGELYFDQNVVHSQCHKADGSPWQDYIDNCHLER